MKKNIVIFFFIAPLLVSVAIFIFLPAGEAHAYAIGGATSVDTVNNADNSGASYNFGNSLQNLIAPFTGFMNNLKLNDNTTINTSAVNGSWPTVNLTPVLESTAQNVLSQWLGAFNAWFYQKTGVQLSAITLALLNLFSWALGLAQQAVNWLLELFH